MKLTPEQRKQIRASLATRVSKAAWADVLRLFEHIADLEAENAELARQAGRCNNALRPKYQGEDRG